MAEITTPRIESISDAGSGSQEQTAPKPPTKVSTSGKCAVPKPPEISAPEDEEKHELDEMA